MKIDWKKENIVFHSHRHFFAARMADIANTDKIMKITGHKSAAVFEVYADHATDQNINDMAALQNTAFGGIVSARRAA
ncbi:MAG: hypothetical protein Ta2G_07040 [Termitinemataceae bacterium]|nr:MAG: hypothetical protein Ta2G_07040 [Termitinemataceae bacterium]